jgi:hypothetical protein
MEREVFQNASSHAEYVAGITRLGTQSTLPPPPFRPDSRVVNLDSYLEYWNTDSCRVEVFKIHLNLEKGSFEHL